MMKTVFVFLLLLSTLVVADFAPLVFPEDSPLKFFEDFEGMYISTYTFTSEDIGGLVKGTNTILMVEKSPVGGIPDKELLCSLDVNVYLYDGEKRFMHAKYAIKNNQSFFVSTENFGGFDNRGWGAVVNDKEVEKLIDIFWEDLKDSEKLDCDGVNKKELRRVIDFQELEFIDGDIFVFTENHLENLVRLIRESKILHIQQFYFHKNWGGKESPLIKELIGKEVKVILDGEWYNLEKNNEVIEYLQARGINAKVEDMGVKVHTKGMIMDGGKVLISSINWAENSITNNREIGVVIEGDVSKFEDVFQKDWEGKEIITEQTIIEFCKNVFIFFIVVFLGWALAKRKSRRSY
jgi:cardiolipin synthase A/B